MMMRPFTDERRTTADPAVSAAFRQRVDPEAIARNIGGPAWAGDADDSDMPAARPPRVRPVNLGGTSGVSTPTTVALPRARKARGRTRLRPPVPPPPPPKRSLLDRLRRPKG